MALSGIPKNFHKWAIGHLSDGTWLVHPPLCDDRQPKVFATGAEAIAAYQDATTPERVDALTVGCRAFEWRDADGDIWKYLENKGGWAWFDGQTWSPGYVEGEMVLYNYSRCAPFTRIPA